LRSFDGFSTEVATVAVDDITVDWGDQAVKSADNDLDCAAFSRSGPIDQLLFEGFTNEQATFGVDQVDE
jgi:hypothetical protein